MEVERIKADTAVIHLPVTVTDEDSPSLKKLLHSLYEEGVQLIYVNFSATEMMRKLCLGMLVLYQKKLNDRGGEIKFVNVTDEHVRHLLKMLDISRIICIEQADEW